MVIIGIPSIGDGGLNNDMNPRFGRCESFTFIEIEENEVKAVKIVSNRAANAMGGAGVQATQILGENNASIVIVGFLGPNAANGLNALNIKIFQAPDTKLKIKEVVNLFIQGKLEQVSSSNVRSHHGMGGGSGMGGGGGGRGMGGTS